MYNKIIILVLPFVLCFNVFAEEIISTRLKDTVVSTKGFPTIAQEENKNISILSDEDIKNNGYTSPSDILSNSALINIKSGEKASDRAIDIRGQGKNSAANVKIMIDSISLNLLDVSHSQLPLDSLNASQIDKVEIIPGISSVLYGNSAMGGTVNIITKADSKKEYGYVQDLYKSYNTNDLSLGIGKFITDKLYINFDYSNLNTDGYRDKEKDKANFLSGGFSYKVTDNQTISFITKYSQNKGTTSNGISKKQIENDRKQAGDFITDYKDTSIDYALKYNYKINDNFDIDAKAYHQEIKTYTDGKGIIHISQDSDFGKYAGNYNGYMIGNFKETKNGINLKQKFSYKGSTIVSGYDYLNNKLLRDSTVHLDIPPIPRVMPNGMIYNLLAHNTLTKDTHSAFILLDQKIISNLSFNAGYRYEVAYFNIDRDSAISGTHSAPSVYFGNKKHDNNHAYSTGLSYDINSLNKIYVSYEKGYISPSPSQMVNKEPNIGYTLNNIKSQTGDNYEIGYKGYVLNSYLTLTGFYDQNNNEIARTNMGILHDQWRYENLNKTRRSGVEAFVEQNIYKVTLNESLSYLNTRVLEGAYKGQKIATVPNMRLVLNTKYEVVDKFKLGARVNYTGKYLENNVVDNFQQSYAPRVTTADLLASYNPINKFNLLAGVNNVFNKKYNISQDSFGSYVVAPGVNYYVGLKYEF